MSPGAITIGHEATTSARIGHFVEIEVGGERSCSVVIGSHLAAIGAAPEIQCLACGTPLNGYPGGPVLSLPTVFAQVDLGRGGEDARVEMFDLARPPYCEKSTDIEAGTASAIGRRTKKHQVRPAGEASHENDNDDPAGAAGCGPCEGAIG